MMNALGISQTLTVLVSPGSFPSPMAIFGKEEAE